MKTNFCHTVVYLTESRPFSPLRRPQWKEEMLVNVGSLVNAITASLTPGLWSPKPVSLTSHLL